jgi:hypothetical protein
MIACANEDQTGTKNFAPLGSCHSLQDWGVCLLADHVILQNEQVGLMFAVGEQEMVAVRKSRCQSG